MKITLIISTYNFPIALNLCLESVTKQTVMPDEIVIADDGSAEETTNLIRAWRQRLPMPVKHVWQENKGFRKTIVMNMGFAVCTGDYIIQIDGDIVMERLTCRGADTATCAMLVEVSLSVAVAAESTRRIPTS